MYLPSAAMLGIRFRRLIRVCVQLCSGVKGFNRDMAYCHCGNKTRLQALREGRLSNLARSDSRAPAHRLSPRCLVASRL